MSAENTNPPVQQQGEGNVRPHDKLKNPTEREQGRQETAELLAQLQTELKGMRKKSEEKKDALNGLVKKIGKLSKGLPRLLTGSKQQERINKFIADFDAIQQSVADLRREIDANSEGTPADPTPEAETPAATDTEAPPSPETRSHVDAVDELSKIFGNDVHTMTDTLLQYLYENKQWDRSRETENLERIKTLINQMEGAVPTADQLLNFLYTEMGWDRTKDSENRRFVQAYIDALSLDVPDNEAEGDSSNTNDSAIPGEPIAPETTAEAGPVAKKSFFGRVLEKGKKAWETAKDSEVRKVAFETTYKTATSILGIKFATDLCAAIFGKGDFAEYLRGLKGTKTEKQEILEILDSEKGVELKIQELTTKITGAKYIKAEDKPKLLEKLQIIVDQHTRQKAENDEKKKTQASEAMLSFVQKKVTHVQVAREALNTLFTASGYLAVRGGVMLGLAGIDRAQRALKKYAQERAVAEEDSPEKSKVGFVLKDLVVSSTTETIRGLRGKGTTEERGGLGGKARAMDFMKAFGTVARIAGIGGVALSDALSHTTRMDKILEAFEKGSASGVAKAVGNNFIANAERLVSPGKTISDLYHRVTGTEASDSHLPGTHNVPAKVGTVAAAEATHDAIKVEAPEAPKEILFNGKKVEVAGLSADEVKVGGRGPWGAAQGLKKWFAGHDNVKWSESEIARELQEHGYKMEGGRWLHPQMVYENGGALRPWVEVTADGKKIGHFEFVDLKKGGGGIKILDQYLAERSVELKGPEVITEAMQKAGLAGNLENFQMEKGQGGFDYLGQHFYIKGGQIIGTEAGGSFNEPVPLTDLGKMRMALTTHITADGAGVARLVETGQHMGTVRAPGDLASTMEAPRSDVRMDFTGKHAALFHDRADDLLVAEREAMYKDHLSILKGSIVRPSGYESLSDKDLQIEVGRTAYEYTDARRALEAMKLAHPEDVEALHKLEIALVDKERILRQFGELKSADEMFGRAGGPEAMGAPDKATLQDVEGQVAKDWNAARATATSGEVPGKYLKDTGWRVREGVSEEYRHAADSVGDKIKNTWDAAMAMPEGDDKNAALVYLMDEMEKFRQTVAAGGSLNDVVRISHELTLASQKGFLPSLHELGPAPRGFVDLTPGLPRSVGGGGGGGSLLEKRTTGGTAFEKTSIAVPKEAVKTFSETDLDKAFEGKMGKGNMGAGKTTMPTGEARTSRVQGVEAQKSTGVAITETMTVPDDIEVAENNAGEWRRQVLDLITQRHAGSVDSADVGRGLLYKLDVSLKLMEPEKLVDAFGKGGYLQDLNQFNSSDILNILDLTPDEKLYLGLYDVPGIIGVNDLPGSSMIFVAEGGSHTLNGLWGDSLSAEYVVSSKDYIFDSTTDHSLRVKDNLGNAFKVIDVKPDPQGYPVIIGEGGQEVHMNP